MSQDYLEPSATLPSSGEPPQMENPDDSHTHSHACGSHCHADHGEGLIRTLPQPQRTSKIGRNDPCLCGSGKKYKKCCLA